MSEWLKPLVLSTALLALPAAEGRAISPNNNNSPEVKAAIGLVEDLAAGRAIGALFALRPHLSEENSITGGARLTPEDEDILRGLRSATLSFKGCRVSEGVVLNGFLVRLIFDESCGDKEAYGVDVPFTSTGGKPHLTGKFTFITKAEGD